MVVVNTPCIHLEGFILPVHLLPLKLQLVNIYVIGEFGIQCVKSMRKCPLSQQARPRALSMPHGHSSLVIAILI